MKLITLTLATLSLTILPLGSRIKASHAREPVPLGARKAKDLAELNELENIQGIRLDVTVPGEIEAAVTTVREAGRGLHGLIS